MGMQICVETPEEFFDSTHFEEEANRQRAFLEFRECVAKHTRSVCVDYDLHWIGEVYDMLIREWELLSPIAEQAGPAIASALRADAYLPTREPERFRFQFVFSGSEPETIKFDIADLDTFAEAVAALSPLVSSLADGEDRALLEISLATFREAEKLARERSCILSWSY